MKAKILKIFIIAIIAAFTFITPVKQAKAGTDCLAGWTKTVRDFGFITYVRYDYFYCDGSRSHTSGWY